jgi:hypothetical protein
MNAKSRKTLKAVFTDPVSKSVEWQAIEQLLISVGATVLEGRGSRVRFEMNGIVSTFHRPHPKKEAKPYQVKDARNFLMQLGVKI